MKWIYKLEYKHGKYYIPNLMRIIVVGMAMVYALQLFLPMYDIYGGLVLDRSLVLSGQVWRLVTFLFVPLSSSPLFVFISLYFYYMMGNALEQIWGGFRFNLYYFLGALGVIIAMFITGSSANSPLNLSLFLAYATLSPDSTFRLFFIIPIKAKWLAGAYAFLMIVNIVRAFSVSMMFGVASLVTALITLLNYVVFFGPGLQSSIKEQIRIYKNRRNWRNR